MELVKVLCLENKCFESNLMSLPKNAKYVSNIIQNDILEAAANVVGRSIVAEIKDGSDIYSIIVDEARDISKQEQMSVCVRYIMGSNIKERFLGFVLIQDLDANSLSKTIHEFLKNINLDITKCVGQSYDGASVMSGSNNGVQVKIRELAKNPCPYIHCYAHRLNLVLVDAAKKVNTLDELIGLLEAIYAFQSSSTIRHDAFIKSQDKCKNILQLPQHCETRWVSKYKGVHFFKNRFGCVIDALQKCGLSNKKREAAEAKGLLYQFCKFETLLMLFYMDEILGIINNLSIYLQKSNLDIIKCLKLVKSTILQLTNMRTQDKFNTFFDETLVAAKTSNFIDITDLNKSRKLNIPLKFSDSHVLVNINHRKNETQVKSTNNTHNNDALRQQYFEIIDQILSELANRFEKNNDFLTAIDACDPNSTNFMDVTKLHYLGELYGENSTTIEQIISQAKLVKTMLNKAVDIFEVHKELTSLEPAFNEIKNIITKILVIPVSSAAAERSFSAMGRIKTYLRSTMTTERLHNTAILSIERELSSPLINDPNPVIDEFAKIKNRRISFTL